MSLFRRKRGVLWLSACLAVCTEACLVLFVLTPDRVVHAALRKLEAAKEKPVLPPAPRILEIDQAAIIGQALAGGFDALKACVGTLPEVDVAAPPVRFGTETNRNGLSAGLLKRFGYLPAYYCRVGGKNMISYLDPETGEEDLKELENLRPAYSNRLIRSISEDVTETLVNGRRLPGAAQQGWETVALVPAWVERLMVEVELVSLEVTGLAAGEEKWIRLCFPTSQEEALPLPTEIQTSDRRQAVSLETQKQILSTTLERLRR